MTDFIQKNAWAIAIGLITLVSTYSLYGYRINELEAQVISAQQTVDTMDEVLVQLQISTAKIETDVKHISTDIDYLIGQVDSIVNR